MHMCLSRPGFYSLFQLGQGDTRVGILVSFFLCFLFLCVWLGVVLNQRQLSIVVSDWESYLGSLFSFHICGQLTLLVALQPKLSFTFFSLVTFISNKIKCTLITLRFGPVISRKRIVTVYGYIYLQKNIYGGLEMIQTITLMEATISPQC